jgi:hypothetical protein
MKFKYKANRPTRKQLNGMSPSELKTMFKLRGHRVSRDFFKYGSVSYYKGRAYRFRWWGEEFVVDVSCQLKEFDRWANSTESTIKFNDWIQGRV